MSAEKTQRVTVAPPTGETESYAGVMDVRMESGALIITFDVGDGSKQQVYAEGFWASMLAEPEFDRDG